MSKHECRDFKPRTSVSMLLRRWQCLNKYFDWSVNHSSRQRLVLFSISVFLYFLVLSYLLHPYLPNFIILSRNLFSTSFCVKVPMWMEWHQRKTTVFYHCHVLGVILKLCSYFLLMEPILVKSSRYRIKCCFSNYSYCEVMAISLDMPLWFNELS